MTPCARRTSFGGAEPSLPLSTTACNASYSTDSSGTFNDEWGWYVGYGPTGCGLSITDHWQMCSPSGPVATFMTLTGFIDTNATQINGYTSPPSSIPQGTVFGP